MYECHECHNRATVETVGDRDLCIRCLKAEIDKGMKAAKAVLNYFGDGTFIRSVEKLNEPGWELKALPIVGSLADLDDFACGGAA